MSGDYGPGGYPGPGYRAPDYDDGSGQPAWPGRQGPQPNGSVWHSDQGYDQQGYDQYGYDQHGYDQHGYDQQGYDQHGYDQQAYDQQGYRDPGYDQPGYDEPGYGPPQGYGDPGYSDQGHGDQGYRQQGYDQPDYREPRYPDRGGDDYDPRGYGQDPGDSSFLPGFGSPDEPGPGRGQAPGRGARYDDDFSGRDPRGSQRGRRPDGPARPGGPGGPGGPAGPGGPRDRRPDPRDDWNSAGDPGPRPRRRATRWAPRILILVVLLALVIGGTVGGLALYHSYNNRYHPADYAGPGPGDVTVEVMSGDTGFSLAPRLVQLGVIASERAFTNAVESATSATGATSPGLEVGYYLLHHHMQASLAYAALTNPKNLVQTTVTIPEGKRAVDVIAIISQKTKIPLKNFQQVLANPSQLGLPSYADGKAEGYLFPATYAIAPHETALEILQAMVTRFNQEAVEINLEPAAKSVGLTPAQLIIEASMAQAEGGSVTDYPKIAEVIHNRLAIGMHLEFDSTVLYGLGKYATSATLKQTQTPGPYNTYLNPGLPVAPISNPGDAAIQGILHPDQGNWLYFLTVANGKSVFSHTPLNGQ